MPAGISRLSLVLGALFAACAMGETNVSIKAYSMLTHDGRRLVSFGCENFHRDALVESVRVSGREAARRSSFTLRGAGALPDVRSSR